MLTTNLNYKKLANLLYEKMTKSRLLFTIGDLGVNICYFKNNIQVESYFAKIENVSHDKELEAFIAKYNKSDAKIILNFKDIRIQHESLPTISSLSKKNPVIKYCDSHFHNSDLYSYKIYQIEKGAAETWKAVIVWSPITEVLERCLFLVKENNTNLAGIYFYAITLQEIAEDVLGNSEFASHNHIYSFVSICPEAGINITINHGNNILSSVTAEYPADKSFEYIQGLIEQNLSDSWLRFKSYITQNELRKINIFLLPKELRNLMESQTYEAEKSFFIKNDNNPEMSVYELYFDFFSKKDHQQATSNQLKSYEIYYLINNVAFKFAYAFLAIFISYAVHFKLDLMRLAEQTTQTYKQYFKYTEEIRLKSDSFPNIENISQLADLYNLLKKINQDSPTPFDKAESLLSIAKDGIESERISWNLGSQNSNYYNITVDYMIDKSQIKDPITELNTLLDIVKLKHPELSFHITRKNEAEKITTRYLGLSLSASGETK